MYFLILIIYLVLLSYVTGFTLRKFKECMHPISDWLKVCLCHKQHKMYLICHCLTYCIFVVSL